MANNVVDKILKKVLSDYRQAFTGKTYPEENDDLDPLMAVFGITPGVKRENRQYWGRELGMCWQLLVSKLFSNQRADYQGPIQIEDDEPCDFRVGKDAVDTKYRVGSGDSGTLKKFKAYGKLLSERGYRPVVLLLREDNLPAAITACVTGGWTVFAGKNTFEYIRKEADFDLAEWLRVCESSGEFFITRRK
jgi:hypothetical protein